MSNQEIQVLVVGAGQAGIAMSEHLSQAGVPHLVLERDRVAERWHSWRWDSLVANGPAWHDRFPHLEFEGVDPDGFASKEQVADYLAAYAEKFDSPICTGVDVTAVNRNVGRPGFTVETSTGSIDARFVVAATGPFQRPVMPTLVPETAGITQIHSVSYRNPQQLPEGAVLVVGSGSSGVQIADEIRAGGRQVYLAVGPHGRPPRSYRGRDFVWWLGVLGKWDLVTPPTGTAHVTIAVSGANGGHTVDFRALAQSGITLLGRANSYENGTMRFASDLAANIANGDANYLQLLDEADAYVARTGIDLPPEPQARAILPDPSCLTDPIHELDLDAAGVTSIIWATGFEVDFSWLPNGAVDQQGNPNHQRGVSAEPGIYYLGLPWQSRRGSSFLWGVWHDAKYVTDQILIQRSYDAYRSPAEARSASGHTVTANA